MTLILITDSARRIRVSQDDAPALHEAYRLWLAADRGSGTEMHLRDRSIDLANDYLQDFPETDANGLDIADEMVLDIDYEQD